MAFNLDPYRRNTQYNLQEADEFLNSSHETKREHFFNVLSEKGGEEVECPCCTIKLPRATLLFSHLEQCVQQFKSACISSGTTATTSTSTSPSTPIFSRMSNFPGMEAQQQLNSIHSPSALQSQSLFQSNTNQVSASPETTTPISSQNEVDYSKCMFPLNVHPRHHVPDSVFGVTISLNGQEMRVCKGYHFFKGIDKSRIMSYLSQIQQQNPQNEQHEQQQCDYCLVNSTWVLNVVVGKRNGDAIQLSFVLLHMSLSLKIL
jgi:hypothetical protein